MKFQILRKTGILYDGTPQILTGDLTLLFEGVFDGAEVIINTGDKVLYRNISDGKVTINKEYLEEGALYVRVTPGISCDRLYVTREGMVTVVSGDYFEMKHIINELRLNQNLIESKVEEIERRLREIYDGHELL